MAHIRKMGVGFLNHNMGNRIDLTGTKINRLSILKRKSVRNKHGTYATYECLCECGKFTEITAQRFRNDKGVSCGEVQCKAQAMSQHYIGKQFIHLKVISFSKKESDRLYFNCKCDCGSFCEKDIELLKKSKTLSCGCKTSYYLSLNNSQLGKPAVNRKTDNSFLIETIYKNYKKRAESNHLSFELTLDEFYKLSQQNCTYCGQAPYTEFRSRTVKYKQTDDRVYVYNGLDRVNSDIGYIKSNIAPCCKVCNYMKRNHSIEYFKQHILKIASHIKKELE